MKAGMVLVAWMVAAAALRGEIREKDLGLGTDWRVGGSVLQVGGNVYAVGGGNVSGKYQISRMALGTDGLPSGKATGCGEIAAGQLGGSAAAVAGKYLYVVGGGLKHAVRFAVGEDGSVGARKEMTGAETPKFKQCGLVASGEWLVAMGGWQTREAFAAKIGPEGELGEWRKVRPLPTISFCAGRCFRKGKLIYVSGPSSYKRPTDRIYVGETEEDGFPRRWRRFAELPEAAWDYVFAPVPGEDAIFFANAATGNCYLAKVDGDGEIGEWRKCANGFEPMECMSFLGLPLSAERFLIYSRLREEPRKFMPVTLVELGNAAAGAGEESAAPR